MVPLMKLDEGAQVARQREPQTRRERVESKNKLNAAALALRKLGFIDELTASITSEDLGCVKRVITDAMTSARMSVRVEDPSSPERGWNYDWEPDHVVRLTAARFLAEIAGIVGSGRDAGIKVEVNAEQAVVTVDQRIGELESLGIPRAELLRELRCAVEAAEAAGPEPAEAAPLELSE